MTEIRDLLSFKLHRVANLLSRSAEMHYRREFDEAKRIKLYKEFQEILHEEQPYTFLYVGKRVSVVQRRFEGIQVYPDGLRPIEWWVPLSRQRYSVENQLSAQ